MGQSCTSICNIDASKWQTQNSDRPRRGSSLIHMFTSPDYIDASMWCITREDLDFFEREVRQRWMQGLIPDDPNNPNPYHSNPRIGPNIYQVNEHYIRPLCDEENGVSWALWRHPGGLKCDVFASHCWSEGVFEFVDAVRQAWPQGKDNLYCCFLSNPQLNVNEVLGTELRSSPFYRALRSAKVMLVIPNRQKSIYSRLWCVYEAYTAIRSGVQIVLPVQVSRGKVGSSIASGMFLFACTICLGFFVFAPAVGYVFGPLIWLFVAQLFADLAGAIRNRVIFLSLSWIVLTLARVLVVGASVGLSLAKLTGYSKGSLLAANMAIDFSQNETTCASILVLIVVLICAYLYDFMVILRRIAVSRERFQLDFSTVRLATCSSAEDEARIREVIQYEEEDIDEAIHMLACIGRYDRDVATNIEFGLFAWQIRDGINPFRVCFACFTWAFWWIEDLWGNHLYLMSFEVPMLMCLLSLSLVYVLGERSMYAVDSLLVVGMAYDFITTKAAFRHTSEHDVVWHSHANFHFLKFKIVAVMIVVIVNLLHYGSRTSRESRVRRQSHREVEDDTPVAAGLVVDDASSHTFDVGALERRNVATRVYSRL